MLKRFSLVLLAAFIAGQLHAKILDIVVSGGLVKCTKALDKSNYGTTSFKPIGSLCLMFHVPHNSFSAGIGADVHGITLNSIVSSVRLAHPLIPVYIKFEEKMTGHSSAYIKAGLNFGIALATGTESINANSYATSFIPSDVYYGKGTGFMIGANFAAVFKLTKEMSFDFAFNPRYYSMQLSRTYALSYQYGMSTTNYVQDKVGYQTIAFPVLLGLRFGI